MSTGYIPFFNAEEQQRIVNAIAEAEMHTSGELRVFIEANCPGDVMERARAVFDELELYRTTQRHGVLLYLAHEDHKFAILGDKGINEKVPPGFWETTKEHLREHFRKGEFVEGFVEGIREAGEQLRRHFPRGDSNENELPNEIVFG